VSKDECRRHEDRGAVADERDAERGRPWEKGFSLPVFISLPGEESKWGQVVYIFP